LSIVNPTNMKLPALFREVKSLDEGYYGNCSVQKGKDGMFYIAGKEMDALKCETLNKTDEKAKNEIKVGKNVLENQLIRFEVEKDGLMNIYDKVAKRYLFKGGTGLVVQRDIPAEFEAWDVPVDSEKYVTLVPEHISIFDEGPTMSSLKFEYDFEGSKIEMITRVYSGYDLVDFKFNLDWHTRRYNLRLDMPMDLLTREANFEIAYGMITRKTTKNNPYEQAKFEVPYHRWLNLSEGDFGISVINVGKYGCSVNGSNVSLSLIRGATMPDFYSDEGMHEFTISIFPTDMNWKEKTLKHATLLNTPIPVFQGSVDDFVKPVREIFEDNESIALSAVKREEDGSGIVMRFYEPYGKRAILKLKKPSVLSNILEDEIEQIKTVEFKPFEIKTIICE